MQLAIQDYRLSQVASWSSPALENNGGVRLMAQASNSMQTITDDNAKQKEYLVVMMVLLQLFFILIVYNVSSQMPQRIHCEAALESPTRSPCLALSEVLCMIDTKLDATSLQMHVAYLFVTNLIPDHTWAQDNSQVFRSHQIAGRR